ncbi:MAG: hypothetical protein KDB05_08570, partial [Planctomycetales bacterium]|nr:hypothetical protein [Planctomycetales bacterium]
MRTTVSLDSISALVEGRHANPFDVLGPHEVESCGRTARTVRAYLPNSEQVWLLDQAQNTLRPMRRIHPAGLYEAMEPVADQLPNQPYQFRVTQRNGQTITMHDPYAFEPFLTDYDLYLLGEGTHSRAYDKLGAKLRDVEGVTGVNFAVWAPNATSVQVVGDFNYWDGRSHSMRKHIPSGIWELFIPGLKTGEKYKFRVKTSDGGSIDKSDPYGV